MSTPSELEDATTLTQSSEPLSPRSIATSTAPSTAPLIGRPRTSRRQTHEAITTKRDDQNEGWPLVAELMARTPDFEAFSRFRELNIKNLLYYQVQLDSLRVALQNQERIDRKKIRNSEAASFHKLADTMVDPHPDDASDQWDLVQKIRICLDEYNTALIKYSQVAAMPGPGSRNMTELRKWLTHPEHGNFCIRGCGSDAWGVLAEEQGKDDSLAKQFRRLLSSIFWQKTAPTLPDLVTPCPRQTMDGLAKWIEHEFLPFWHSCVSRQRRPSNPADIEGSSRSMSTSSGTATYRSEKQPESPTANEEKKEEVAQEQPFPEIKCYREKTMLRFTSSVATVIACILPTIAIGVLSTAHGNLQKLLYIGGFTALFSIGLMALTDESSRVQIFTATAAFSAVLVVFVQNQ